MTGKVRTVRVDKGFGFVKDETGKEYFFHRSAVYGEGSRTCAKATVSSSTSARDPRGLEPRTSDAPPHNHSLPIKHSRINQTCHRSATASPHAQINRFRADPPRV